MKLDSINWEGRLPERKLRLQGKVAIVTGAGSRGTGVGNGRATAILFAREGASVLLADYQLERAEETLAMIEEEGGTASTIQVDVTSDDDCKILVDAAVERYGRLDILDNNVGNIIGEPVTEIDPVKWDELMALNLKSMMLTSRHAIPRMAESGGGSIINISSINGARAAKSVAYSASKAGVNGLTIAMAADHGRQGIRVNAIAPGAVYTPMVSWNLSDEMREHRKNSTMLGTEGTPWDVGWAAVFLASDEARWITGTVLTVDGGASMMSRHAYTDE